MWSSRWNHVMCKDCTRNPESHAKQQSSLLQSVCMPASLVLSVLCLLLFDFCYVIISSERGFWKDSTYTTAVWVFTCIDFIGSLTQLEPHQWGERQKWESDRLVWRLSDSAIRPVVPRFTWWGGGWPEDTRKRTWAFFWRPWCGTNVDYIFLEDRSKECEQCKWLSHV